MRHDAYGLPVSTEAPAALERSPSSIPGGDCATADRQLGMLRERSARDGPGLIGDVLVPLSEGLHAFAACDYRRAVARLEPVAPRVVELGGSRAQRDVFHDTLLEACFRAGDMNRGERLLAECIARRLDHFGKSQTAMDIGTAAR